MRGTIVGVEQLREDDPTRLGPFTLRGRLGAGGMGVVYLGVTDDGTEVAVKTVPRGVGSDVRVRLRREAELLRTIDHPRIARFVDADPGADEPWLAMRYVSGPSLSDAQLPLPPAQLRQLADGLAEALAALHRLGVTHRDVKPGNVIMTTHGAVLVDLGIAVTADAASMTMAGTAVGSPAWMAPEQFAGDPAGPSADVWGWAAVLVYAATGHEPFGTGTLTALAHRIMSQPPNLQGVPDWLLTPVRYALTKAPDRRPPAADLVRGGRARVLAPALTRPGGPSLPPGGPAGSPSVPRRHAGAASGPFRTPPPGTRPGSVAGRVGGVGSGPVPLHPSGAQLIRGAPARRPPVARRRWFAGVSAAVVVAVAVTIAVVLLGGGSGGSPSAGPTGGDTSTSGAPVVTVAELKANGLCEDGCVITGRVAFVHPEWGKVTLVSTQADRSGTSLTNAYLAIFDTTGQLRWSNVVGPVYTLKPVRPAIDSLHHIFLTYNPGRYDGVIVLSADDSSQGMTDYASVPLGDDTSAYRFYDASVTKVDGRYRIVVERNDCMPTCAPGTVSRTTYAWDGSEYSPTG